MASPRGCTALVIVAVGLLILIRGAPAARESRGKFPGTCGLKPTSDPACAPADFGSCGNACCSVEADVQADAPALAKALSKILESRGPDGAFTPAKTWGTFFTLDAGGCRDLSASSETTDQLLCQAGHTTSGEYHFVDTVNVRVGQSEGGRTRVQVFSVSNVAGALGDNGQNHKNVAMLLGALEAAGIAVGDQRRTFGCGRAAK